MGYDLLMGLSTHAMWNFAIGQSFGSDSLSIKYWYVTHSKIHNYAVVSLVDKHGFWKLKLYYDNRQFKYHLYYGTKEVLQTDKLRSIEHYISTHK